MAHMKSTEHVALYRKYRPEKFSDVAGQDHITDTLAAAIKNGKIGHAYLFAGSHGTGKTTIARILAREIGTTQKDLYEMDAASNRRIEDFRELNESVYTLPFDSKYKVYIIDEVHMLTKEAFNAFLKTLEEPPTYVVFILATTQIEKLPDTIVSRCEVHTFKQPTRKMLTDIVTKIAKKEGFTLEKSAADLIAILAEGSFRDALGTLQKVLAASVNTKMSVDEVAKVTGAPKSDLLNALVQAIADKNLESALSTVAKAVSQNIDMLIFQKLLLHRLRAVLLLRYAKDMEKDLREQFSDDDFKLLKDMANSKEATITSKTLGALLEAFSNTPFAYIKQLPLELALTDLLGVFEKKD